MFSAFCDVLLKRLMSKEAIAKTLRASSKFFSVENFLQTGIRFLIKLII